MARLPKEDRIGGMAGFDVWVTDLGVTLVDPSNQRTHLTRSCAVQFATMLLLAADGRFRRHRQSPISLDTTPKA